MYLVSLNDKWAHLRGFLKFFSSFHGKEVEGTTFIVGLSDTIVQIRRESYTNVRHLIPFFSVSYRETCRDIKF